MTHFLYNTIAAVMTVGLFSSCLYLYNRHEAKKKTGKSGEKKDK